MEILALTSFVMTWQIPVRSLHLCVCVCVCSFNYFTFWSVYFCMLGLHWRLPVQLPMVSIVRQNFRPPWIFSLVWILFSAVFRSVLYCGKVNHFDADLQNLSWGTAVGRNVYTPLGWAGTSLWQLFCVYVNKGGGIRKMPCPFLDCVSMQLIVVNRFFNIMS